MLAIGIVLGIFTDLLWSPLFGLVGRGSGKKRINDNIAKGIPIMNNLLA